MFKDFRVIFGVLLIVAGVIVGLQQYGIVGGQWDDAFFTLVFAAGAYYFYTLYQRDKSHWWFAFLTVILAALTLENLLNVFVPTVGNLVGGALFLGLLGLAFLLIYYRDRTNWWAIIPGGVMLSLAAVSVFDNLPGNLPFDSGGILFLGMGLTFLVLSFLRVGTERLSWAIFPAVALLAFGFFVGLGETAAWNYIWPTLLIIFGIYFLFNSFRKQ